MSIRSLERLRAAWERHGRTVLLVVVAHAVITAGIRLGFAFYVALVKPNEPIDLLYRYEEVRAWFGGARIYGVLENADYAPASYAMLWPFMGWLPTGSMRIVYGLVAAACLLAIAVGSVRASGARTRPEMAFMGVFLLPFSATQMTLWVGQIGLVVVACLLVAALLLVGRPGEKILRPRGSHDGLAIDLLAAILLAGSLVKPTLSVPVVASILVVTGRWRPALLTGAAYLGLTLVAAAFQEATTSELIALWLGQESGMNIPRGSANVHLWLHWLGSDGSLLPVSFAILIGGIVWSWRHRAVRPWIVIGVGALLGRLWIHHRAYDDVVLVITAVALFQIASDSDRTRLATSTVAAVLLGWIYASGHIPMWAFLRSASTELWLFGEVSRTMAYVATLGFCLWYAHTARRRTRREAAPA